MLNTDSEVRVEGLETLDYLDNLYQKERFTEQGDALTFESEVRQLMMIFTQVNNYIYQVQVLYKS
jgi:glucose-6-phosphate 1-epimerase